MAPSAPNKTVKTAAGVAAGASAAALLSWLTAGPPAADVPEIVIADGLLKQEVLPRCSLLLTEYKPTPWAANPHMQTVLGLFRKLTAPNRYKRQLVLSEDGGTVALDWFDSCDADSFAPPDMPIVLVCHGINGGSHEGYCKWICARAKAKGWRAVVLNYRGCNGLPLTSSRGYTATLTRDVYIAVESIKARFPQAPLCAVGYSLGGLVLTKYLGEAGCGLHGPTVYAHHRLNRASGGNAASTAAVGSAAPSAPTPQPSSPPSWTPSGSAATAAASHGPQPPQEPTSISLSPASAWEQQACSPSSPSSSPSWPPPADLQHPPAPGLAHPLTAASDSPNASDSLSAAAFGPSSSCTHNSETAFEPSPSPPSSSSVYAATSDGDGGDAANPPNDLGGLAGDDAGDDTVHHCDGAAGHAAEAAAAVAAGFSAGREEQQGAAPGAPAASAAESHGPQEAAWQQPQQRQQGGWTSPSPPPAPPSQSAVPPHSPPPPPQQQQSAWGCLSDIFGGSSGHVGGLAAAAVVSSPVCLWQSAANLSKPWSINLMYNLAVAYKLKEFVQQHQEGIRANTLLDVDTLLASWTVQQVEDCGISATCGFANRQQYYEAASSLNYIPHVRTPTLILLAKDDPFLGTIPDLECERNPNTLLALTRHGGHVAFLQGMWPLGTSFMDDSVLQFFEKTLAHYPYAEARRRFEFEQQLQREQATSARAHPPTSRPLSSAAAAPASPVTASGGPGALPQGAGATRTLPFDPLHDAPPRKATAAAKAAGLLSLAGSASEGAPVSAPDAVADAPGGEGGAADSPQLLPQLVAGPAGSSGGPFLSDGLTMRPAALRSRL